MAFADVTTTSSRRRLGLWLSVLGLANATAPFSTDPYLPGLPRMVSDLHAGEAAGQLSLTTFVIALAVGLPLLGGICDSVGRRGPMLAGASAYACSALACAFAPNMGILLGLRAVQGFAASAGIVGARAMVRDIVSGPRAASIFSGLFFVTGVAPIVSPMIGAGLIHLAGWRGIFAFMTVFGLLLVAGIAALPETLKPEHRRPIGLTHVVADWRVLLRDREYTAVVFTVAFAVAAMFGFITSAPFVLRDRYGLGPTQFAVAFGIGAAGFTIGNYGGTRIVARTHPARAVATGCCLLLGGGFWLLGAVTFDAPVVLFVPGNLLMFIGAGMTLPNAMALALTPHPERAGSAAALLGVGQFVIPGLIAPVIGAVGAGGFALPVYEITLGALATACYLGGRVAASRKPRIASPAAG